MFVIFWGDVDYANAKDGTAVIADDPWLQHYENKLKERYKGLYVVGGFT